MQPVVVEDDQSQVEKPHLHIPHKGVFVVDISEKVLLSYFLMCAGVDDLENDHDQDKNEKAKE